MHKESQLPECQQGNLRKSNNSEDLKEHVSTAHTQDQLIFANSVVLKHHLLIL